MTNCWNRSCCSDNWRCMSQSFKTHYVSWHGKQCRNSGKQSKCYPLPRILQCSSWLSIFLMVDRNLFPFPKLLGEWTLWIMFLRQNWRSCFNQWELIFYGVMNPNIWIISNILHLLDLQESLWKKGGKVWAESAPTPSTIRMKSWNWPQHPLFSGCFTPKLSDYNDNPSTTITPSNSSPSTLLKPQWDSKLLLLSSYQL